MTTPKTVALLTGNAATVMVNQHENQYSERCSSALYPLHIIFIKTEPDCVSQKSQPFNFTSQLYLFHDFASNSTHGPPTFE